MRKGFKKKIANVVRIQNTARALLVLAVIAITLQK